MPHPPRPVYRPILTLMNVTGNATKDLRLKRITPRQLQLAIRGDEELDTLVRATIAGGGVTPFIHKALTTPVSLFPFLSFMSFPLGFVIFGLGFAFLGLGSDEC